MYSTSLKLDNIIGCARAGDDDQVDDRGCPRHGQGGEQAVTLDVMLVQNFIEDVE